MSLQSDLDSIQQSEQQLGTTLTAINADITQIQLNVQALLAQIASATSLSEATQLAQQASAQVSALSNVKASLDAVVTSSGNAPPPTVLAISPATATVTVSTTQQFTSNIATAVFSAASGTIDQTGLYTAPTTSGTDQVTLTDSASSQSVTASVIVVDAVQPQTLRH